MFPGSVSALILHTYSIRITTKSVKLHIPKMGNSCQNLTLRVSHCCALIFAMVSWPNFWKWNDIVRFPLLTMMYLAFEKVCFLPCLTFVPECFVVTVHV